MSILLTLWKESLYETLYNEFMYTFFSQDLGSRNTTSNDLGSQDLGSRNTTSNDFFIPSFNM